MDDIIWNLMNLRNMKWIWDIHWYDCDISDTNTVKLLWKLHITDSMYHRYERSMLGCHFFPVLVIVQLIGSNPYFSKRCISLSMENRSNSIIKPNIGQRLHFFLVQEQKLPLHTRFSITCFPINILCLSPQTYQKDILRRCHWYQRLHSK